MHQTNLIGEELVAEFAEVCFDQLSLLKRERHRLRLRPPPPVDPRATRYRPLPSTSPGFLVDDLRSRQWGAARLRRSAKLHDLRLSVHRPLLPRWPHPQSSTPPTSVADVPSRSARRSLAAFASSSSALRGGMHRSSQCPRGRWIESGTHCDASAPGCFLPVQAACTELEGCHLMDTFVRAVRKQKLATVFTGCAADPAWLQEASLERYGEGGDRSRCRMKICTKRLLRCRSREHARCRA